MTLTVKYDIAPQTTKSLPANPGSLDFSGTPVEIEPTANRLEGVNIVFFYVWLCLKTLVL